MIDLDQIDSWDFDLPEAQIAASPPPRRGDSRLLTLRADGSVSDGQFADLLDELHRGDVLVFNDTRVLQARMIARRETGGRVELLVVGREREAVWTGADGVFTAMIKSNRRVKDGERLLIDRERLDMRDSTAPDSTAPSAAPTVELRVLGRDESGLVTLAHEGRLFDLLDTYGRLPLPPYIEERRVALGEPVVQAADDDRYQTVLARDPGAVAAPTAGLHFSEAFLDEAQARGVRVERVTLHVGIGTFRPVRASRLSDHVMHEELCRLAPEVAVRLNAARAAGGRIIAVGTTVVRTLESFADDEGVIHSGERMTGIFLRPGSVFRGTDALLTNFHLPKSTLLALVAAFSGFEPLMAAYRHAVRSGYRFFSYGDAMWLPSAAKPAPNLGEGDGDERV